MVEMQQKLEYIITESHSMLVVSFIGVIAESTANEMKKCQAAVLSKIRYPAVILNFHGSVTIETSGVPHLIQLQKALRKNQMSLYLCSIDSTFKKLLLDHGALREAEMVGDLMEAIKRIESDRA